MTSPKEIAEKIDALYYRDYYPHSKTILELESLISEALEEAMLEGRKDEAREMGDLFQENVRNFPKELKEAKQLAYDEGYAKGIEDYTTDNHIPHEMIRKEAKAEAYNECAVIAEVVARDNGLVYLRSNMTEFKTKSDVATLIEIAIRQRAENLKGEIK